MPVTKGYLSYIGFDPDGAGATAKAYVSNGSTYEYDRSTNTSEVGPYFGDNTITDVPGGKKHTIKLEGDIPEGGDTVVTAMDTYDNATSTAGTLTVGTVNGLEIVITNILLTKFNVKADAKGQQSFSIEGSGVGTVAAAPTAMPS